MNALKKHNLFADLPDEVLTDLENALTAKEISAKDVLFYQEDEGVDFFIVSKGAIRIERITPDGKRLLLSILGPGEIFGEMSLITGNPRMANAIAHTDSTLLTMRKTAFDKIVTANASVSNRLMTILSGRLMKTGTRLETVGLASLQDRLGNVLLDLHRRFATNSDDPNLINLKITQTDLADLSVSSREHINKILKAWKDAGVIDMEKGFIHIHDTEFLEDLSA